MLLRCEIARLRPRGKGGGGEGEPFNLEPFSSFLHNEEWRHYVGRERGGFLNYRVPRPPSLKWRKKQVIYGRRRVFFSACNR